MSSSDLNIHEERVWRLHQSVEFVLLGLEVGGRAQQIVIDLCGRDGRQEAEGRAAERECRSEHSDHRAAASAGAHTVSTRSCSRKLHSTAQRGKSAERTSGRAAATRLGVSALLCCAVVADRHDGKREEEEGEGGKRGREGRVGGATRGVRQQAAAAPFFLSAGTTERSFRERTRSTMDRKTTQDFDTLQYA